MNALLRLVVSAGAVALAVYGLNEVEADWHTEIGPALLSLVEIRSQIKQESQNARRIEEQDQILVSAMNAKEQIVVDLVADRLTLLEAAARFRELREGLPTCEMEMFRQAYPGNSDDERYCHQVIRAVESLRGRQPNEVTRAVARLKKELEDEAACGRAICLP
jgi:hypothetical protein